MFRTIKGTKSVMPYSKTPYSYYLIFNLICNTIYTLNIIFTYLPCNTAWKLCPNKLCKYVIYQYKLQLC